MSALRWADSRRGGRGDGMLVTVRRGKTNPEGETKDVRFVKGESPAPFETLRSASRAGPARRPALVPPSRSGSPSPCLTPEHPSTGRSGLCPVGRRAGAGGRAPAEIPWSLESTSAPQPIALPSTTPSSNGGGELYSR